MTPDLVVLGNLLVDDVVLPDGRTRMGEPGGAVLYAALGASLWGVRVGVVSWRGDDYPAWALEALATRGVDPTGVRAVGGPGLRTWLLYEGRRRRVVHRLEGPPHAAVSPGPGQLPGEWRSARAFHLAPMPFDIQRALVADVSSRPGALVSLDPFLLVRPDTLATWRGLLPRLDAFFLGEDEMELPDAAIDPRPALRSLAGGRLRYVVLKRGAAGGLVYDSPGDRCVEWSPKAERVVDTTGAGDAFSGGFLAGWLLDDPLERVLERAVVSASFAIEAWGVAGILEATPERARQRLHDWFGG